MYVCRLRIFIKNIVNKVLMLNYMREQILILILRNTMQISTINVLHGLIVRTSFIVLKNYQKIEND
jgi:hypothetical protein